MPVLMEPYFYSFGMQLVCFSPNQGGKKTLPILFDFTLREPPDLCITLVGIKMDTAPQRKSFSPQSSCS